MPVSMASTPPLQIRANVPTPSTPLHGAAYDHPHPAPRYPTRSSQRRTPRESLLARQAVQVTPKIARKTPQSPHTDSPKPQPLDLPQLSSPAPSPNRRSSRRVQVVSPSSPDFAQAADVPSHLSNSHSTSLSSTANMTEGMLPTPVKTPRKKNIPDVNATARVLFQDQPILGEEVEPPSRRSRRGKRYNGFSLEAVSADNGITEGRVQIFTDSRDNVPQLDKSEDNPFVDHLAEEEEMSTKKVAGTSKRRKLTGEVKRDPQVEEAIKNDQGMVYVFRGKKVFRKFDDNDDEEEEIDVEDLGLLEHNGEGPALATPLKTLTRKSIKPTRLFQTQEQKRSREAEKEEEAVTDIEEEVNGVVADVLRPESSKAFQPVPSIEAPIPASPPPVGRSLRSATKKEAANISNGNDTMVEKVKAKTVKKSSPFDSWKRVKSGSSSGVAQIQKGRKRAAHDDVGSEMHCKKAKAPKTEIPTSA